MKVLMIALLLGLGSTLGVEVEKGTNQPVELPEFRLVDNLSDSLKADSFDFPVGIPNARGYYNAQGFGKNNHLGDDWNALTGGNSDLGDPVYAIANGYVNTAHDFGGGWGNVIRIVHYLPDGEVVESLYAHCDTIMANPGTWVEKGTQIGTIGDAHGVYPAHLHLELRSVDNMPLGGGYSAITTGYLDPSKFIRSHR